RRATDSLAGPRVELARYLTSDGERVIYAVRVGGMVVVSDWPAGGPGRAFVIERGVSCERELYALLTDYVDQSIARDEPATRVAVREVWRITNQARRERSFDGDADVDRLIVSDDVAVIAERRQTLRALDELPERQARILVLHGCGFTYAEIARMTGAIYRTVD